jgi:hypothetical protein
VDFCFVFGSVTHGSIIGCSRSSHCVNWTNGF